MNTAGTKLLKRRLDRLEVNLNPTRRPRKGLRWVVAGVAGPPANSTNSTCTRTLCTDGTLMELVKLDGHRYDLTDEDLVKFIESFPINEIRTC